MATGREYEQKIKAFPTHEALLQLWEGIKTGSTPGWDAGKAFEYLIVRAFEIEGAEVRYPYLVQVESEGKTITILLRLKKLTG